MSDPVILEDEDLQTRPPRVQPPVSPGPTLDTQDPALQEGEGITQLSDAWNEAVTPAADT